MIIIHIACHTILIESIEEQLREKNFDYIILKSTTSLVEDFIDASLKKNISPNTFQKTFKERYQRYIIQFIEEQEEEDPQKIVVFIGPNMYCYDENETYTYDEKQFSYPKGMFSFEADYKYYIKDDPNHVIRLIYNKYFDDHVDEMCEWFKSDKRKEKLYRDLRDSEQKTVQMMNHRFIDFFRFGMARKKLIKCARHYRKKSYHLFFSNKIVKEIRMISNHMKRMIKQKEKEKEKRI